MGRHAPEKAVDAFSQPGLHLSIPRKRLSWRSVALGTDTQGRQGEQQFAHARQRCPLRPQLAEADMSPNGAVQIRFRFHTTKTRTRPQPGRNSAPRRAPDSILDNPLCCDPG